ncbi:MAG: hypothetical protein MR598_01250 [Erysipelotrichaceae bacterium]|nr:hypothetical protein [Erysipelotrichaceae bacterium]
MKKYFNSFHWNQKINILIMVLFLIVFILFMGMIYITNKEDVILKKDLTCEFRKEVYVMDFVFKLNGEVVDNYQIDTSEVGKKKVSLSYRNRYGFVVRKSFEIEVKDVTAPIVVVDNPYIVEKDSLTDIMDNIFCADDYDDKVTCNIVGKYDLSKVGKYDLKIIAIDQSENITTREFSLHVIEEQKRTLSNHSQNLTYTNFEDIYKKYKKENTRIGLDISKWQQEVDFSRLKEQGVSFVMLKVGGQKKKGGEISVDPNFYENIDAALRNGIEVGIYFYSYATSEKEAQKQARWVLQKVKDYDITLPIAFDWENWNTFTSFHISFHTLNKIANSFLQEVEKNGYQSMLYSSKYYLDTIWYQENYTTWLAYYTKNNDYDKDYVMWQVCSDGKIDGIDGYVDIDVMYIDKFE